MSEQKRVTEYMRGRVFWAKIFGAPRPNYDGDGREWTLEFEPNDKGVNTLKEHGLSERLKDRSDRNGYEGRDPYMILKRKEFKFDGSKNEHIRVVDALNKPWVSDPEQSNRLIGNGSEVDVKVTIVDYGPRKKKGIYPVAIRVLDLVPYEREEFAPLDDDDEYAQKARKNTDTFTQDFDLEEPETEEEPQEQVEDKPRKNRRAELEEGELDDDVPM